MSGLKTNFHYFSWGNQKYSKVELDFSNKTNWRQDDNIIWATMILKNLKKMKCKPVASSSSESPAPRLYKWWDGGRGLDWWEIGSADSWSPFWSKSPFSWSFFSRNAPLSWRPFSALALTWVGGASTRNFLQTLSVTWLHTWSCSVWHWLRVDVVQSWKIKNGFSLYEIVVSCFKIVVIQNVLYIGTTIVQ